jgi:microcystin-dependent protein
VAEKFDSPAMPGVKPMPEPPDPRIIPLDRQAALTHQQVEQVRFGLGDTGPLAQAVMNANVPALAKQLATGAVQCLSTRRPADPVVGQMIFETDTQLTKFWSGSAWVSGAATPGASVLTPVGSIVPYGGSEASTPAGWLFCGGQAVSRSTYADLFAVVSTTYGAGDGSTTFNVPDLRGRVLAGKDNMGGTAANRLTSGVSGVTGTTLGAAGGDQRIQDHTHTFSGTTGNDSPDHSHSIGKAFDASAYGWSIFGGGAGWTLNGSTNTSGASTRHTHTFSGTTANHNQTSGGASQNVQPTIVTNYIIKALADTVTGSIGSVLTGAAGGDLTGTYPNPTITNITNAPVHNSNTSLSFRTSGTERMSIDANGRTLRPYQPVASLYKNSGLYTGTVSWSGSYVNTGSIWNGATRVTVPIAGVYRITFNGMGNNVAGSYYVDIYKNGGVVGTARQYSSTPSANYEHVALYIHLQLAANDYIEWVCNNTFYSDGAGYAHASVELI